MTEDNQGKWTLERNRIPHADHTQNHKKKGLSKFMKASTTSPSKAGLTGGNVLRRMRDEHGAVTDQERRQIQGVLKRKKTADRCAVVPKELQGSFGGLQMWADAAEHNSREKLTESGEFGIHTTYVCIVHVDCTHRVTPACSVRLDHASRPSLCQKNSQSTLPCCF